VLAETAPVLADFALILADFAPKLALAKSGLKDYAPRRLLKRKPSHHL
jgi:hypothetical protein